MRALAVLPHTITPEAKDGKTVATKIEAKKLGS
jgi:hypothetical protein